tara:strand:+ start:102 stop:671 length:570 start_codon:yes stop_codon:yes gene_type:complete
MEIQIVSDMMQLCSTREYGLRQVRDVLSKGYSIQTVTPDDTSYLLLVFLEQESPWKVSKEAREMEQILRGTDATRLAMAMVQRGVHNTTVVATIFKNLLYLPDLDPRTSHILCNILHLIDVDSLVDCLFPTAAKKIVIKLRLNAAMAVSKRTRLRTCRNVVQLMRCENTRVELECKGGGEVCESTYVHF